VTADAAQRVVVVTGGGGGIGAAIAEELGRRDAFVVTMDPLVSLDGSEDLPPPEETPAGRIVAAGGSARATSVSVTDGEAVRALFEELAAEHGRLDGVVNVAGITRPTSFARGSEDDWRAVLDVHLSGYLNVLAAALPIMATAGSGRILGVTSGSGWRAADAGAYGCAKRAVAALTWQLGRVAPAGVSVNAISPIAVTRMVTAALERMQGRSGGSSTGGLSLGSMPQPEELGPFGAHLVGEGVGWCRGQVLFAGGPEVAVIEAPRLLEAVRADDGSSVAHVLDAIAGALASAEADQATSGASNPRFGAIFDEPAVADLPPAAVHTCAVVVHDADEARAITAALGARGVTGRPIDPSQIAPGFAGAADALRHAGPVDAVVVGLAGPSPASEASEWERVLAEHVRLPARIHDDAGWARAVADRSAAEDRPMRLVTVTDAATAGGRSRAQASAQLARAARGATGDRVSAFAVGVEGGPSGPVGELVAHLACSPEAPALSGAELVAGAGWFGLRSHPRPSASITIGGSVPDWLDHALQSVMGGGR
jgi:NAD(P)-dependent dehydrogenase (short-subunit alcohol dehydrogenase family)